MEVVDEEYHLCEKNFMTLGNMSQKLWPNMLLFSLGGHIKKINIFENENFKLVFKNLYICVCVCVCVCVESFESFHFDQ